MAPVVTSVVPERAVVRGRVTITGSGFAVGEASEVVLRDIPARIAFASSRRLVITIPDETVYPTEGSLDLLTVSVLGNPENRLNWLTVAAAWLMGSGLVGLAGMARRRRA